MKHLYNPLVSGCLKLFTFLLCCFPIKTNAQEYMRANLFILDASGATLVDGNLTNYNNIYSNTVDINDGWKMTNPGMNFGILRDGYNLVVERRAIIASTDTTFFRMWNMPQYHYRICLILSHLQHPGLSAVVKDNYLNTKTDISLNDTSYYDFVVDANAASSDQMRFQLIFETNISTPVDVNFAGIKVQRKGKNVVVDWDVATEVSVESYTVQHSADGSSFRDLQQVEAYNTPVYKTYSYEDIQPLSGDNFYRIKAINFGGRIQYSPIAKINALATYPAITVYPNPVLNKTVQLHFTGQPAGRYYIVLLYSNGIRQQLSSIQLGDGQSTQSVNLPKSISPGVYKIQVNGPNKLRNIKTIEVL